MRARPTKVYDSHPDSPRLMYDTEDGHRYTPEQWQLMLFMRRLETKLDRLEKEVR